MLNKIKGSMYGFAIGDAMGATTEFMDEVQIKKRYGEVRDIIGGGWLHLKAGEVTDDTQMTLCVCEAIEYGFGPVRSWSYHEHDSRETAMLDRCCANFVDWYNTNPKDVGCTCSRVISFGTKVPQSSFWHKLADDPDALGNGSLMRTMPIALSGLGCQAALLQGRLTHNNDVCDNVLGSYYKNMVSLLENGKLISEATSLAEPTGHVINTFINSIYWTQSTNSFEEAIIGAVNHGGDADTISAITGSLVGALYGYEAIPERWILQLDPKVRKKLSKYSKIFSKMYVQNRKNIV